MPNIDINATFEALKAEALAEVQNLLGQAKLDEQERGLVERATTDLTGSYLTVLTATTDDERAAATFHKDSALAVLEGVAAEKKMEIKQAVVAGTQAVFNRVIQGALAFIGNLALPGVGGAIGSAIGGAIT